MKPVWFVVKFCIGKAGRPRRKVHISYEMCLQLLGHLASELRNFLRRSHCRAQRGHKPAAGPQASRAGPPFHSLEPFQPIDSLHCRREGRGEEGFQATNHNRLSRQISPCQKRSAGKINFCQQNVGLHVPGTIEIKSHVRLINGKLRRK